MSQRQPETANLHLTDWHYGKHTGTYDPATTQRRLDGLLEKVGRIRELKSCQDFDRLVIHVTGDMNDGSEIYAGQAHEQAVSNVEAQANDLSILLAAWLERLTKVYPRVELECVPGNHGRTGKFGHYAANWDIVCYRYLALRQQLVPVRFTDWTDGDPFVRKVDVRGHRFLLYHGHDVRSYSNIPWYGIMLRLVRWFSSSMGPFDVALFGHFHTIGFWRLNGIRVMLSGTAVSGDEWGLRSFGLESACSTWFWGTSDRYAITWQYALDLT